MMNAYSPWLYFLCMGLLFIVASTPILKAGDKPPQPSRDGRVSTLDGLRGFLALAVFFNHASIYYTFIRDDDWKASPSPFYSMLGQMGVGMFFMITGYLFWARMIRDKGNPQWLNLYIHRFFRIAPLYLFAVLIMLAIVAARTHFQWHVPPIQLLKEIGQWLMLGLRHADVNGYRANLVLAGVTWTLKYEWWFYASLLVTSLAARGERAHLIFSLTGLILTLSWVAWENAYPDTANDHNSICLSFFFCGMASASLRQKYPHLNLRRSISSFLVVALLIAIFSFSRNINSASPIAALGMIFFLICNGESIFGLLISRPAIRLGDVSYSMYLLQGPVLTLLFAIPVVREYALASTLNYWIVILLCGIVLILFATFTYAAIERPAITLGRKAASALDNKMKIRVV